MTRKKENMQYKVMGQSRKNKLKTTGMKRKYTRKKIKIICDERIRLTGVKTAEYYPQELRLVTAEVEVKRKMTRMEFITNNFD